MYFEANTAMHVFCTTVGAGVEQITSSMDFNAVVWQANLLLQHTSKVFDKGLVIRKFMNKL